MNKIKEQSKSLIMKAVSNVAKNAAVKSANTTCSFFQHQAVVPDEVKKLRKF